MTGTFALPLDGVDLAAFTVMVQDVLARHGEVKHHEVYLSKGTEMTVIVERGSLKDASVTKEAGFGIRVASAGGQVAFSHASRFDRDAVEGLVKRVSRLMGAATPDPDFHGFAPVKAGGYLDQGDILDPTVASLEPVDGIEMARATLEDARSVGDPHVHSINVLFSAGVSEVVVFNSDGVEKQERGSSASLSCDVTVKDGAEMNSSYEYRAGRMLDRLETTVGSIAVREALGTLGGVAVPSGAVPVVLSEKAVASVACASLAQAANAEALQQGASFLQGKQGQVIAPAFVSLVDDGRLLDHSRLGTSSFDGEGTPTGCTVLVDHGRLAGCMHNAYTSRKEGVPSTGNAARSGYDMPPGIARRNLVLDIDASMTAPREELFRGISRGIYFDQTHDSVNVTTGDFSGMMSSAWLIEDGEITRHVEQAAFGITLFDLLASIELASKTVKDRGGIVCPALRLRSMQVSGSL